MNILVIIRNLKEVTTFGGFLETNFRAGISDQNPFHKFTSKLQWIPQEIRRLCLNIQPRLALLAVVYSEHSSLSLATHCHKIYLVYNINN